MKAVVRNLFLAACAFALPGLALAGSVPVQVSVGANSATVRIGSASSPLADLSIRFDEATGISAANLGIRAETVSTTNPALLARLPSNLTSLSSSLPLMITVEPPVSGSLVQKRVTHVEVHTHLLSYAAGSRFRLFKAQIGGPFHDITESVQPGSVRTRGTTPGWSQFLVVIDLRPTDAVITEKLGDLNAQLNLLPSSEATPLRNYLNTAQSAIAVGQYEDAIVAIDMFSARVAQRAGTYIPDTWRSARDLENSAGALLAGANTLLFSLNFRRDYGN